MKIYHISDLHFGDENSDIINSFVAYVTANHPDLILISGDLTQRAKISQYKAAQAFIKQLKPQVLCVPGNHDIPLGNLLMRNFFPFKRYKHYINDMLDIHYQQKGLNILGLNTANPKSIKKGKLWQWQIQKINSCFKHQEKYINIIFFHHNFTRFESMHTPLSGFENLLKEIHSLPINLICTGHLHYSNIASLILDQNKKCYISHAGSLSCNRTKDNKNSFNEITIGENNEISFLEKLYCHKTFAWV